MLASAGLLGLSGATLSAAVISDGVDPLSIIKDFGFPTAVVLLFIFGWIRTKGESERQEADKIAAQQDAAAARAEHTALVNKLVDDVVPALTRSADATAASTAAVQEMTRRALSGGG